MRAKILIFAILTFTVMANAQTSKKMNNKKNTETATFANGCFWCTEAIFQQLDGVKKVTSGYTGGKTKNPTYNEVVTGKTGHAEAIQIKYNPEKISYLELLEVFFSTHDPTTLNRQGYDVGTQYRSAIFYHSNSQKQQAEAFIKALIKTKAFDKPIVTEIDDMKKFYIAENYHQNYYNNNKTKGYCTIVINPKLEKFKKDFKAKLKQK